MKKACYFTKTIIQKHETLNFFAWSLLLSILFYSCDKNEFAPVMTDQEFTVSEGSPVGFEVGTVVATDGDAGQVLSYEIVNGNDGNVFELHRTSGVISIKDQTNLDYESTFQYTLQVVVSDNFKDEPLEAFAHMHITVVDPGNLDYELNTEFTLIVAATDDHQDNPLESTANIRIEVLDENEFSPQIESLVVNIVENPTNGQVLGRLEASHMDIHQQLTFSLNESEYSAYLSIDPVTGTISVSDSSAFDFESIQQIQVEVEVNDGHEELKSSTAFLTINISDIIEFTDGLTAYYPFEGNGNDVSGNEIHGTVNGAILTKDRFGSENSAYSFDGMDDYILLPENDLLRFGEEDFSITAWYEFTNDEPLGRGEAIMAIYHASGDREYILGAHPNNDSIFMNIYHQGGSSGANSVYAERAGGWHMVSITKDDSSMRLYLDGELQDEVAVTAQIKVGRAEIMIGALQWSTTNPDWLFDGKIDDVSLHNRALEAWEVENIYLKK